MSGAARSGLAAGLQDSLSRVGVSLVLHLEDREQPLYGDVVTPLDARGSFGFAAWGAGIVTLSITRVKSATSPDLRYSEYREIRGKQRAEFAPTGQGDPGGCDGE